MRTPRREAGSLINRPVTIRTKPDFRHPRTGGTALYLPSTTELVVINLIPQHDPQANPEVLDGVDIVRDGRLAVNQDVKNCQGYNGAVLQDFCLNPFSIWVSL